MSEANFRSSSAPMPASSERSSNLVAVVLAAGQGTRMKSTLPKVLHEVLGRPLVHFSVLSAQALEPRGIVVVVGHGRDAVEASVRTIAPDATFAVQAEQRGTADAVRSAEAHFRAADRVLILSGDVPGPTPDTIRALVAAADSAHAPLAVVAFRPPDPTGYGRCLCNESGQLLAIVEHKDAVRAERHDVLAEGRCNAGIYLCDRVLLDDVLGRIATDNAQGELYLTDIARLAAEAGTPGVVVTVDDSGEVEGVNDRVQLAQAESRARALRNVALMKQGVTFRDPARVSVGYDVVLSQDVIIEADVVLRGKTTVATGVRIGQGSIVENARLDEGAELLPYCVVSDAVVGARAAVGPFAHLRPGTVLGKKAKVGNFVETKKARLGDGAKASHLTYLGDCVVGAESNIGAGTITCNYDGVNKHETVLGERVFVGSNTAIVAPCRVGDDAVIGAGTTVTKDVPAGALALNRAPQLNAEGWSYTRGPTARKASKGKG